MKTNGIDKIRKGYRIPTTSEHFLLPYILLVVKYKLLLKKEFTVGQQITSLLQIDSVLLNSR